MKAKPTGFPVALLVTGRASHYGSAAVEIIPCERKDADASHPMDDAVPWTPERVGGVWTDSGSLSWTVYRHAPGDVLSPRPLSLDCVMARFRRASLVSLEEAEDMVKAHRTVAKRLRALRDKMGYPEGFAEQVTRIALAFGAEWIAIERKLYLEAMQIKRPDAFQGKTWVWIKVGDARGVLAAIRDVDLPKGTETTPAGDVWYESKEGMLPEGWYLTPTEGGRRGPYATKEEALEA